MAMQREALGPISAMGYIHKLSYCKRFHTQKINLPISCLLRPSHEPPFHVVTWSRGHKKKKPHPLRPHLNLCYLYLCYPLPVRDDLFKVICEYFPPNINATQSILLFLSLNIRNDVSEAVTGVDEQTAKFLWSVSMIFVH